MEDLEVEERLAAEEPRFAIGEFVSNVVMAVVLGYIAWRAYGAIRPLIIDDSISFPVVFEQSPTEEDLLPEGFEGIGDNPVAKSRFIGQTPGGVRFWLLASSLEDGEICLFVSLADGGEGGSCSSLERFAADGLLARYEDDSLGLVGAGRYLAEGMEVEGEPSGTVSDGPFSYVEAPQASGGSMVSGFQDAVVTGGIEVENN